MPSDPQQLAKRILICGRLVPAEPLGGLQIALTDLGVALEALGWDVDLAITPESLGLEMDNRTRRRLRSSLSPAWSSAPRMDFIRGDSRRLLRHLLLDGGGAHLNSAAMGLLAQRLRENHYAAVIAVISRETPGLARFIISTHPNVVLVSLDGLSGELRLAPWLPLARFAARIAGAELHPAAYRAADPSDIRTAVFASESWRDEALQAGLPPAVAKTVYFGVPKCPPLAPLGPVHGRLLWVGRASRDKGLHRFIDALALVRRTRPLTLTAVCGHGPVSYRRQLVQRIERHALGDAVRLVPAVARHDLPAFYRSHDALLFDSPFAEPVALVPAEAFAYGLPVVARRPSRSGPLLVPDETCVCFPDSDPHDIADAIFRLLDDDSVREKVRRQAHELVRRQFTMTAAAHAYDAVLRRVIAGNPRGISVHAGPRHA